MQALSSCSSCEGDFAAGARGMPVAGAMPLSWKWRKKLASLAEGLQLIAGLDLRSDGKLDSPTHAGSTGVSLQRLSGQDGLMQAIDNTTTTAVAAETHILTRTRRPCFGLWSCWFVLASVVLAPLEAMMGLNQAIDSTTCSVTDRDTYLTRTRRRRFKTYSIWSSWFVLASEVLPLLEAMAMGHVLAAAGH